MSAQQTPSQSSRHISDVLWFTLCGLAFLVGYTQIAFMYTVSAARNTICTLYAAIVGETYAAHYAHALLPDLKRELEMLSCRVSRRPLVLAKQTHFSFCQSLSLGRSRGVNRRTASQWHCLAVSMGKCGSR